MIDKKRRRGDNSYDRDQMETGEAGDSSATTVTGRRKAKKKLLKGLRKGNGEEDMMDGIVEDRESLSPFPEGPQEKKKRLGGLPRPR